MSTKYSQFFTSQHGHFSISSQKDAEFFNQINRNLSFCTHLELIGFALKELKTFSLNFQVFYEFLRREIKYTILLLFVVS